MSDKKTNTRELEHWLAAHVGDLVDIPTKDVDVQARFDRYGIDSAAAVGVTLDLESHLGRDFSPTLLYEHPTIERLAAHLTQG